jgi:hypothetical protein
LVDGKFKGLSNKPLPQYFDTFCKSYDDYFFSFQMRACCEPLP